MRKDFNSYTASQIKVENRDLKVSRLITGDLIKTKAETIPLIYHYGLIEKDGERLFIWHNHPDKINSTGGSTIREPLDVWIKGKDIVSVEHTHLDASDIHQIYESLKEHKYDFLNFNCEHFVNFAKGNTYASRQVIRITGIVAMVLISYYMFGRKK